MSVAGKGLLIITFSYSPAENPRAYRWTALSEEFVRRGACVQIVSAWSPGLASYEEKNGVCIHRVGYRWMEALRARLACRRQAKTATIDKSASTKHRFLASRCLSQFWRNIAWPDTSCTWYFPAARKALEALQSMPQGTSVVSVSPTFTAALVGHTVMQKHKGRWVIDMGDPFSLALESPANNFMLYNRLNRLIERRLFSGASAIALTNQKVCRAYGAQYPESARKLSVIPPLVSAVEFAKKKSEPQKNDALRLVYSGKLYKNLRRPDVLLEIFERLCKQKFELKIELHFYGQTEEGLKDFESVSYLLEKYIFLHGPVSREIACQAIESATAVINLGNSNPLQLPSKIVEYMSYGKPILNLIQTPADPSLELLGSYGHALTILKGRQSIFEQVDLVADFLRKVESGKLGPFVADRLEEFTPASVASKYSEVLFGSVD